MKMLRLARNQLVLLLLCALTLIALLALGRVSYAQTDAYSIEVAVSERSDDEEQDAYTAALRRILLNNSGDKTILNRNLIRQALGQAEDYVQAFSYRRPPPGTVIASDTPITSAVQQSGQATQLMLVSFDRSLVSELIASSASGNAGLDTNDPETDTDSDTQEAFETDSNSALVWLLIKDEGRDILISEPAAANVQSRAREIAGAAGISLVYPTGDAEDLALLSAEDIESQTFDEDSLQEASSRYAQGTVLIGYLSRLTMRGWQGQWTRISGSTQSSEEFETSSLDEALQKGLGLLGSVSQIDETYRYGGSAASGAEGLVWVGSLNTTEGYAQLMSFFEGIQEIGTVYAKEVQTNSMVFSVIPRSALSSIEAALVDAPWLRRTTPPVSNSYSSDRSDNSRSDSFSGEVSGNVSGDRSGDVSGGSDNVASRADLALEYTR